MCSKKDTVWLTQKQIAALFGSERSVITKHIRNLVKSGELSEKSVCAKFAHTAEDGKVYNTRFYNLDMIISIGYRVNSKRATSFRIWATSVLKKYLVKGFVLNQKRLKETQTENLKHLEGAVKLLQQTIEKRQYISIRNLKLVIDNCFILHFNL
ncbi:virulence RhuM family protein [Patescibacteria group bacterium]|nr:virulence RhuM family protein [Patescibacteria group bacterium]MBU1895267.1 virulence RhuM family protein [Patescibacteria group bacterium]